MDLERTPLAAGLSRDLALVALLTVVGICLLTEPFAVVDDFLLSGLHSAGAYMKIGAFALMCAGAAVILGPRSRRGVRLFPAKGWWRDPAELGLVLGFGSLAALVLVLIPVVASEAYVVLAVAGVAGVPLILPIVFSKRKSRRMMWAVGVVTIGTLACAAIPAVSYEPFVVLVMAGAVFVFFTKFERYPLWALMAAVILAGLASLCLGLADWLFPGSYAEVNWAIGISGCCLLALLPGRVLFGCSRPVRRRILAAAILYLLALAVAWQVWAGFGWMKEQIRLRERQRTRSQIRGLAVNLETYYIDHNIYPPPPPPEEPRKNADR